MSQNKLIGCVIVPLTALALFILAGRFYWTRGVYVRITNNTETTLGNVDIVYWQGIMHIGALKPKASRARYVNPSGESDLTLEWLDPSGAKHSREIGVYIETNYAGSVEITVEPGNTVSVTDKVRLRVIDRSSRSRTYLL